MASISSHFNEAHSQDKTRSITQKNREEKSFKNKKTLEEGKVLRKKIRHLRREDERQAKSLTQDLKDIRESLSDVNNVNQTFDGHELRRRGHRSCKETHGFYNNNSTRTEQRKEKHCEVKSDDKNGARTTSKRCDNFEDDSEAHFASHHRKTVRFEDDIDLTKKETEWSKKQNETMLSLSSIQLK